MDKILLIITFIAQIAYAESPKVECELVYERIDSTGASVDYERGAYRLVTVDGLTLSNHAFTMNAQLEQICAMDGGPCSNNYTLHVMLTKDSSISGFSVMVNESKKNERYSSWLNVANEIGTVVCGIE